MGLHNEEKRRRKSGEKLPIGKNLALMREMNARRAMFPSILGPPLSRALGLHLLCSLLFRKFLTETFGHRQCSCTARGEAAASCMWRERKREGDKKRSKRAASICPFGDASTHASTAAF
jgi:hypothetical protein